MKKLIVLSGSGISAESGIQTFRDMGGIWEQYDVTKVASPVAWEDNPELVLRFYNERRKKLLEAEPNEAHIQLRAMEKYFDVQIITQNVDDLHERAGSKNILHLHGEIRKARSTKDPDLVYPIEGWELKKGDLCEKGSQLRPHVVWFGESVPNLDQAADWVGRADILLIIGTSLNVYPAAGLVHYAPSNADVYVIDPNTPNISSSRKVTYIQEKASTGMKEFKEKVLDY